MREPTDTEIKDGIEQFINRMLTWTIKLVRIENNQPQSMCSGFIYERNNEHILLTVFHSFQRNKADLDDVQFDGWYIETDVVSKGQVVLIPLPPIQFVKEARVTKAGTTDGEHADFVWGFLDIATLNEQLRAEPRLKGKDITLPVYGGPIDQLPDSNHGYGFASFSHVEHVPSIHRLIRDPVYEAAMLFAGYDSRGLYRFKLEGKHKGHDFYFGSSGSPIADDEGNIIALVQGGCEQENVIFGVPLARYAAVLDVPIHVKNGH